MDVDQLKVTLKSFASTCHTSIDSTVFRLHCLTVVFLCFALFIAGTSAFVSSPISCEEPRGKIESDTLTVHCNLQSTYRLVRLTFLHYKEAADAAPPDAYGQLEPFQMEQQFPSTSGMSFSRNYRVVYKYFSWIWLIYFFMAIGFCIPNILWQKLEGGQMKNLINKMDYYKVEPAEATLKLNLFAHYLDQSFGHYRSYLIGYILCEGLAIGNIFLQMTLLNLIFHKRWYLYGYEVLTFYWEQSYSEKLVPEDTDPMVLLFPKQTKCEYNRTNTTGVVDPFDAYCVLPMNHFNDKFFLLFWFWVIILLGLFAIKLPYRLVQYSLVHFRYRTIKLIVALEVDVKQIFSCELRNLIKEIGVADWFVLYHMGTNIESLHFYETLAALISLRKAKRNHTPSIEPIDYHHLLMSLKTVPSSTDDCNFDEDEDEEEEKTCQQRKLFCKRASIGSISMPELL